MATGAGDETLISGKAEERRGRFIRIFWKDPNTRLFALTVFVGALGALSAILFRAATRFLVIWFTGNEDVVTGAFSLPYWERIVLPAAGGLIGGIIARQFVRIGGTMGIAQIMEVVALGRRRIRFRQSAARTVSSLSVISTGGSEGREGPIIQMSAAFASALGRHLKVSSERARVLVACGMAAGVAGAYNAPIAGTLFVVELVMGSFTMAVFGPAVISASVSALLTRAILGNEPLYKVQQLGIESVTQVLFCVPLGIIAGWGSVLFMRSLRLAKRIFHRMGWRDEWRMALAGLGVGIIGIRFPHVWGNGFEGTNHLFQMQPVLAIFLALFVLKILATSLTIGSGGVGGVFTPALMTGAALGGSFAIALNDLFPHFNLPVTGYAVLGMGGLLAATTRAPFLAILMMSELTQKQSVIVPMMLVSLVSIYGAKLFERESVYVEELRESGVEWKETTEAATLANIKVKEVLRKDVSLIPSNIRLPEIVDIFLNTRAFYLFVGEADGRLLGVIDLHDLKEFIGNPELLDAESTHIIIAADLVREVPVLTPEDSLASASEKLSLQDFGWIPVINNEKERIFLGIVTQRDILGTFDREILRNSKLFARIKHETELGSEFRYFQLPQEHQLLQIDVPFNLIGKTIAEAEFRKRFGITVVSIQRFDRDGTEKNFVPSPDEQLQRGDRLIILASNESIRKLRQAR